jgi:hypothetical protein
MSLQSNGATTTAAVTLNADRFTRAQTYSGLTHSVKANHTYENYVLSAGAGLETKKKAFMELMQDFVNSPEFEVLTYELMNEFNIRINHDVNTSL